MTKDLKSSLYALSILIGLSLILLSATNHYILTINFFNNSGEYFSGIPEHESSVFDTIQKYVYLTAVLYTVVKLMAVALVLHTALYLSDREVPYSSCFKIATYSEFIFLIPAIIKIVWFRMEYPNGTLSEWHKLYVLSMLSIVDNVSADWYYPLQTLNIFEIAYWFLLAFGINKTVPGATFDDCLRVVLLSYLPALFIWVAAVTFCSLMLFPTNA